MFWLRNRKINFQYTLLTKGLRSQPESERREFEQPSSGLTEFDVSDPHYYCISKFGLDKMLLRVQFCSAYNGQQKHERWVAFKNTWSREWECSGSVVECLTGDQEAAF